MTADEQFRWRCLAAVIFTLTVVQLAVGALVPGLDQFDGKAFGARLIFYPVLMLVVPAFWRLAQSRGSVRIRETPWRAYAALWSPFLIDVTGNSLNLYDTVSWWDDVNHLVNWFLLSGAIGLLVTNTSASPRWAVGSLAFGFGAALAICWEVGEWYAFIRHGTELEGAYEDTLGDEMLGLLGAAMAGLWVARRAAWSSADQKWTTPPR